MGVILFLRHGRRKKKVPVYRLLEKSRKTTRNILAHPYTHELKGAPNGGLCALPRVALHPRWALLIMRMLYIIYLGKGRSAHKLRSWLFRGCAPLFV